MSAPKLAPWPAGTFTTEEAAELLRVRYHTIDYGVATASFPCTVPADGSGSERAFTVQDLLDIQEILTKRRIAHDLDPAASLRRRGVRK